MIIFLGSISFVQVHAQTDIKTNFSYSYDPNITTELRESINSKVVVLDPENIKESLEGEYAFVPRYSKGKTKVTVVRGGIPETSYKPSSIKVTKEQSQQGR